MADSKVSALTALAITPDDTDEFYINDGGVSKKIAYSTIKTAFATAAHAHGNITNAGAVGSTANLPIITGVSGVLEAGAFGTGATNFCAGNDARLQSLAQLHAAAISF
jgi:hypothetical protein